MVSTTDMPTLTTKRPWFRFTPGRLLAVLLAAEGVLWLSERFQWFGWHKGYAVLTAVASVVAFFLLMLIWFLLALVFRWRFQYSILSLLVLMVAVAAPFAWLGMEMKAAREQREAVEWVEKAGGRVTYDYQLGVLGFVLPGAEPPEPPWLCKVLGDNMFTNVAWVDFYNSPIGDAGLEHLKRLTKLQELILWKTKVSDAGVKALQKALPQAHINITKS
jgi:hypothetical protein